MTRDGSYRLGIGESSARIHHGVPGRFELTRLRGLRKRPALESCLVQVRSTAPGTGVAQSIHERPPRWARNREQ
jgi:hypothetical protein